MLISTYFVEPSPLHTTTIVEKCTLKLVDEYKHMLCQATEPLSTFLEYITYVEILFCKLFFVFSASVALLPSHNFELSTWWNFLLRYGHMIDNVVLIVTGTLHERDVQELLEKCHPLGMFDRYYQRLIFAFRLCCLIFPYQTRKSVYHTLKLTVS